MLALDLEGRLIGVPWVVARNVSFELWLRIEVKHVAFLELWLGMTSLELWLVMTDEHEELLGYGSGWRVLSVWVCVLWRIRMGPVRFPFSVLSLRVWQSWDVTNVIHIGNSTWRYGVYSVTWFPTRALPVVASRCGSKTFW